MGWEYRGNRLYYYRKRREGKRVVSEYIGNGLIGELAEIWDIEDSEKVKKTRADWLITEAQVKDTEQEINDLEVSIRTFTRAFLLVLGYHPHKRQWRRKRNV